MRIDGNGNGKGKGYGYGNSYGNGDGNGDGNGYGYGYGYGKGYPSILYHMTPFAYLTFRGVPHDATFENFSLHLQVEQLVHRRMG